MAETSVPGAVHRRCSGDRPNRTGGSPPPPPSSPADLISALPDAVIHHIFSFLPLGDVVRTSALSKRWRSTWTAVTDLVFDGEEIEDGAGTGSTFGLSPIVDSVLSQCTSPMVKRLHVTGFHYHEADDYPDVDRWVEFAEEHRVEDLGLRLIVSWDGFRRIPPQLLYCLSGLVRLEVSACRFSLDGTTGIWWPRLKVLSMEDVELSDDILGRILRGSPVLESLELRTCWGMKNIVIDSTSVKDLLLIRGSSYNWEKIRAPHLLSLHVSGTWYDRYPLRGHEYISLDDISSLVEAKLDFAILTVWPGKSTMGCDLLKELLEKLRGVPTITIGGWCFQTVSLLEMEGVPSPLSKCQNLMLIGSVDKWDLPGIAYMLRSSHCLEKLVIDLTGFRSCPSCPRLKFQLDEESKERFNFDEDDFLCSRKGNFESLGKHLKRVEIIDFREDRFGSKPLLALIKFILGDALVLEKLILKAKLPTRCVQKHLQAAVLSKRLGVSKNVLSCPRASKKAEVIFNFPFE